MFLKFSAVARVRKRQACSELSDFERGRIIGLHEVGLPIGEIAGHLGRTPNIVL
mgnify:FL=1